jgi:hypothetical protein
MTLTIGLFVIAAGPLAGFLIALILEGVTFMVDHSFPLAPRPLSRIANDISRHWPKPWYGAVPYIGALHCLYSIDDTYINESARGIVRGFLSNASSWRGADAKRIKAELKGMVK